MDDELRRLEDEVAATGDPQVRLSLARLLDRLGRRDDALLALWPGRASLDVRRALSDTWERVARGPGYRDVAPIHARPSLRWRTPAGSELRYVGLYDAGPLGVVCQRAPGQLAMLDADDGALRWEKPWPDLGPEPARAPRFEGGLVVVPSPAVTIHLEPWSGKEVVRSEGRVEAGGTLALAESPSLQVALRKAPLGGPPELVLRDRTTGEEQLLVESVIERGGSALARDVAYHFMWHIPGGWPRLGQPASSPVGRLRAHDARGRLLWSLDQGVDVPFIHVILPLPHRVCALGNDSTILCLEG